MKNTIDVHGAREHNLKNISVSIPRQKFVVITGISGSGKSSLAFDTIYAEGQRRYVESLSAYARQFLGQSKKPDVDAIDGLSPAIAIDQKTKSKNPRSTVGTVTEIYDFLRLLYARAGTVHCPQCKRPIERVSVDQISDAIMCYPEGSRLYILAPIVSGRKGTQQKLLQHLRAEGYVRARIDGEFCELEDDIVLEKNKKHTIEVVIDRLVLRQDIISRLTDSLETALALSGGLLKVRFERKVKSEAVQNSAIAQNLSDPDYVWESEEKLFSENYSCPVCNISIGEISPRSFSFNSPYGACPDCSGLGEHAHIAADLVVSEPGSSLLDGAITTIGFNFSDDKSWARAYLNALHDKYKFDWKLPWQDLPENIRQMILYGDGEKLTIDTSTTRYDKGRPYQTIWEGVIAILERRYRETMSGDVKEHYLPYVSVATCPKCQGARLKAESLAVTMGSLNIYELTQLSIRAAADFITDLKFAERSKTDIAAPILREIKARLKFMLDVGLDYLTLSRAAATLSGGESQRIRLATQIGSGLAGVLYVLDEPSIGLHQRDNARLLNTLLKLRDLGNTVIVVEHDEETIWEADYVLDIGPQAGEHGGQVVAAGRPDEIMRAANSITGAFLSGRRRIAVPALRRATNKGSLQLKGARANNLRGLDVDIPLGCLVCVTGVSGSGKSSLVNDVLWQQLQYELRKKGRRPLNADGITGIEQIDKVISIDQSPIGRTPRSNPATYTGVFDDIRQLFAQTQEALVRGYKPGRFSFNVKGGRCEACQGDGVNCIEMHFLPDVYVTCDVCQGKRYNRETLEVRYKGKNIAEVLQMTVAEALEFFQFVPRIVAKLQTLYDVGLGYIRLGQASPQLSGGEAQRIKLAAELSKRSTGRTFYILDEPTTGLHFADVQRLSQILERLVDLGNTVLVIEHNLDIIKLADYIIDLGPEGGNGGGEIVAIGSPEEIALNKDSYTGQYLAQILNRSYHMAEVKDDLLA